MVSKKSIIIISIVIFIILILIVFAYLYSVRYYLDSDIDILTGNNKTIDISQFDNNIIINSGGTYNLTGTSSNHILIDAPDEDVTLVLNNVEINSNNSSAIIGKNLNSLNIDLVEGSTNTLYSEGKSDYKSSLYVNGDITFTGEGTLNIAGNQLEGNGITAVGSNIVFESGNINITAKRAGIKTDGKENGLITIDDGNIYIDADGDGINALEGVVINNGTIFISGGVSDYCQGIDTNDGFTINGGTVIALGVGMLETPLKSSDQKTICLSLDEDISSENTVTLANSKKEEVISFVAPKDFKTILISNNNISDNTYYLYQNNLHTGKAVNGLYTGGSVTLKDKITINDSSKIVVSDTVTSVGNNIR